LATEILIHAANGTLRRLRPYVYTLFSYDDNISDRHRL